MEFGVVYFGSGDKVTASFVESVELVVPAVVCCPSAAYCAGVEFRSVGVDYDGVVGEGL